MARRIRLLALFAGMVLCPLSAPADEEKRVTLLLINDHYTIDAVDGGKRGGIARLGTLLKEIRVKDPETLFLHAGDFISPSVESIFLRGEQMVGAYNALGLSAATFGNHEFDFGDATLRQRMNESRFSWVSSNVYDRATGKPFGGAAPWLLREVRGVKVGVLGLTLPETAIMSSPSQQVEFRDPFDAARRAVAELKQQGASVIVAVTHLEVAADEKLAREVLGINVILGGHEHEPIRREVNGVLILKAGSDARLLGEVVVTVESGGRVTGRRDRMIPVDGAVPDDAGMAALRDSYLNRFRRELDQPLGRTAVPLDARTEIVRTRETNLGNLIADIMRARTSADVALMNGGGIRGNRLIPTGTLTRGDVFNILPFPNVIVAVRLTGKELAQTLENGLSKFPDPDGRFLQVSGLTLRYDPNSAAGSRTREIKIGGKPLDPDKTYVVAVNDYMASGKEGFDALARAPQVLGAESGPPLSSSVVEWLEKAGKISPAIEDRIVPK